jgi:tRNA G10  N-methylase Trm11
MKRSNRGYRVGSQTIYVQVYADDVVIFSETKENMEALLKTVEDFTQYCRLAVNAKKCKFISYIIANKRRIVDEHTFSINGEPIPGANFAEWTDYIRTATSTTLQTRMKETEEALSTTSKLIENIQKLVLKLNKKLDAMRRFAISTLDYILTKRSPRLEDLKKLDV